MIQTLMNNIGWVYNISGAQNREDGAAWYPSVRQMCLHLAHKYRLTPEQVAGVIAALSPRNKWKRNIEDMLAALEMFQRDGTLVNLQSATFRSNVAKAEGILKGDMGLLKGPKVNAFLDNITNPSSARVTVDVWAVRIALNDPANNATKFDYGLLEAAYQQVAESLGLQPCTLQAITWVEYRQRARQPGLLHNIRMF